ncbi:hypothetical protein GCM10025771_05970 [Niveibacterium umoris]|uniref:Uncharacterized protein n=1 Tax=Niveibacterium umoris TaxID=1193620 RepID=A0A840BKS1_9RHOO|nr:hypothetical protein [Niveibacterium umoris]MBB4013855.1 hypothetical protein [Niveibacterium umoris]
MAIATENRPDFSNPDTCLAWLASLNPTNLHEAHSALSAMFSALAETPPLPARHLEVLEAARSPVEFVQTELARRYAARPLPPVSQEDETLRIVLELWQHMLRSYTLIAQRSALDPAFIDRRPMLAQRRIHYHGALIIEYFRARREVPPGMWSELHRLYGAAEDWSVATVRVAEPLNETWRAQSCAEAYIAILLTDASNPYGRTPREFTWILRWAQRFAPHCSIHTDVSVDEKSAYAIDLSQDFGLRPIAVATAGKSLRRVDSQRLAAHIQAVVAQFKRGASPASLGLGEDCVQPACARLLVSLYRPWGLAAAGRRFPRRSSAGSIQIATDLPSIGFFVAGRPFEQPSEMRAGTFRDTMSVYTIGEQVESAARSEAETYARAAQLGLVLEHWEIADQSLQGFRIARHTSGSRIDHRQLVALRPADGENFLLAEISWLMYRGNGQLLAGVSLMAGVPQMVGARIRNANGVGLRENYHQAFILPAVPALKSESSLVIPAGWYQADRVIDVHGEKPFTARILRLVARGTTFDRVTFERLPA